MAFSNPKVLILGHSFIRRLEEDINNPKKLQFHMNFGLNQCAAVYMHESSWKISLDYDAFLNQVRHKLTFTTRTFDAAVIQLGGNDLCLRYCNPLELASKLDDFANWLKQNCAVRVVYICELFTRKRARFVSPENYEARRIATNTYLATLLEDSDSIKIWRHRRIFNSPNNIFDGDGTHLNCLGTKKFYESLKRAVILAIQASQRN